MMLVLRLSTFHDSIAAVGHILIGHKLAISEQF